MMRMLPLLIAAGLVAGCNDAGSTSDDATAAGNDGTTAGAAASGDPGASWAGAAVVENGVAENTVADDVAAATNTASPTPASAESAALSSLPLRRGYYVASDISCGQASNATLMLVRRGGINTSRVPCDFQRIEKIGATTFRVTEQCSSGGAAWGTEDQIDTRTLVYEIPDETSFTVRTDDGGTHSARYCAQARLPEPWRNNDIGDITND